MLNLYVPPSRALKIDSRADNRIPLRIRWNCYTAYRICYNSTYCCLCYIKTVFFCVTSSRSVLDVVSCSAKTHWLSHWCTTETAQLTSVDAVQRITFVSVSRGQPHSLRTGSVYHSAQAPNNAPNKNVACSV